MEPLLNGDTVFKGMIILIARVIRAGGGVFFMPFFNNV